MLRNFATTGSFLLCLWLLQALGGCGGAARVFSFELSREPATRSSEQLAHALPAGTWRFPALNLLPKAPKSTAGITALFAVLAESESGAGARAISVNAKGDIVLWDVASGQGYLLLSLEEEPRASDFLVSQSLLAVALEREVRIYRLSDGALQRSLSNLGTRCTSVAFDPHGNSLLLGGADGRAYRWRLQGEVRGSIDTELARVERYIGASASLTSLVMHPFGRFFVSADLQGGMSAWLTYDTDLYGGEYDQSLFGGRFFSEKSTRIVMRRPAGNPASRMVFSRDGQYLITGLEDGSVEVWDVRGAKQLLQMPIHKGYVYDVVASSDGKRVVSAGRDGTVKLTEWSLALDEQGLHKASFGEPKSLALAGVRRLLALNDERVLAGDSGGRVIEVDFKHEAPE